MCRYCKPVHDLAFVRGKNALRPAEKRVAIMMFLAGILLGVALTLMVIEVRNGLADSLTGRARAVIGGGAS